jgi:hypothetical protein
VEVPLRSPRTLGSSVLLGVVATLGILLLFYALFCAATLVAMLVETVFPGFGLHAGKQALENRDGVIGFLWLTFKRTWIVLGVVFIVCGVECSKAIARYHAKPAR